MKTFQYPIDLNDDGKFRFVIVDKNTGKISEPVVRCLSNFKDYVVVGTVIEENGIETYTFIATENIEGKTISITRDEDAKDRGEHNKLSKYSEKDLDSEAIKRAKDLVFSF